MGRRGPLIAGAVGAGVILLLIFFLILPKMGEVGEAGTTLERAQTEQQTLESRLRALEDARDSAPDSNAIVADVDRQIPPTADIPGVILLLDNAATQSSIDLKVFTPGVPVFDPATGLSRIDVAVTIEGTYFELDEFLFRIETLPRAAKTLNASIAPGATFGLSMQATVQVYTSDASAGPGSEPGPTEDGLAGATGAGG